jgi:hypothetical protein
MIIPQLNTRHAIDAFVRSILDLNYRNSAYLEVGPDQFVSRDRLYVALLDCIVRVPDYLCPTFGVPIGSTYGQAARHQLRRERVRQIMATAVYGTST